MNRIYLDNAATTALDPRVLEFMMPYLTEKFGNPSAIYSYGRDSRLAIENARKSVARMLNAYPAEIFFTSGGTESSNTAIQASVSDLGCRQIITSPLEHHATLHTAEQLQRKGDVSIQYVDVLHDGHIDLEHLNRLLGESSEKSLVTLMHANNEMGNLLDLTATGNICKKYHAVFHSDTVQTVGHYPFDLHNTPVHFITASAHKFHGPKGAGMLYISEQVKISPLLHGGAQERNMRAGTENIYGIAGFARALELATNELPENSQYIKGLKLYMAEQLLKHIPGVGFNGDVHGQSLYTVLNVSFPRTSKSEMLLYNLDINNICASGGSACSSGVDIGSHVIRAMNDDPNRVAVRFSFSRFNTKEEIDITVGKLKKMM